MSMFDDKKNTDLVSMSVSPEMIKPIVESKIRAAILSSLGRSEDLISAMVDRVLLQKVNNKGVVDGYDSYNKTPLIEWMVNDCLRNCVKEALVEWSTENKDQIKAVLKKQLQKSPNKLVKLIVDGIGDSLQANWKFNVTLSDLKQ